VPKLRARPRYEYDLILLNLILEVESGRFPFEGLNEICNTRRVKKV